MTVFAWIGIIVTALAGLSVLLVITLAVLFVADERRDKRRQQRRRDEQLRTPTQPSQVVPWPEPPRVGEITDPRLRAGLLAASCAPCTGDPVGKTCICAGHCGSQRCAGPGVFTDMSGALLRITREGHRG